MTASPQLQQLAGDQEGASRRVGHTDGKVADVAVGVIAILFLFYGFAYLYDLQTFFICFALFCLFFAHFLQIFCTFFCKHFKCSFFCLNTESPESLNLLRAGAHSLVLGVVSLQVVY